MRAKAKSSSTPYPIWVEGEYITEPPIRPSDGAIRPVGHYIDKGGYPGANVYEVDINTMCRQTDAADRFGKPIYEQDILLYETAEEIGYFIVQDLETTVDIVNGEIIEVGDLDTENIKNIGSMVDYSDFVEGIRYHADNGLEIPWNVWRDMKEMYGRQYLKPDDIEEYKVKFDGAVHFLMHTEELKGAYENAERKR